MRAPDDDGASHRNISPLTNPTPSRTTGLQTPSTNLSSWQSFQPSSSSYSDGLPGLGVRPFERSQWAYGGSASASSSLPSDYVPTVAPHRLQHRQSPFRTRISNRDPFVSENSDGNARDDREVSELASRLASMNVNLHPTPTYSALALSSERAESVGRPSAPQSVRNNTPPFRGVQSEATTPTRIVHKDGLIMMTPKKTNPDDPDRCGPMFSFDGPSEEGLNTSRYVSVGGFDNTVPICRIEIDLKETARQTNKPDPVKKIIHRATHRNQVHEFVLAFDQLTEAEYARWAIYRRFAGNRTCKFVSAVYFESMSPGSIPNFALDPYAGQMQVTLKVHADMRADESDARESLRRFVISCGGTLRTYLLVSHSPGLWAFRIEFNELEAAGICIKGIKSNPVRFDGTFCIVLNPYIQDDQPFVTGAPFQAATPTPHRPHRSVHNMGGVGNSQFPIDRNFSDMWSRPLDGKDTSGRRDSVGPFERNPSYAANPVHFDAHDFLMTHANSHRGVEHALQALSPNARWSPAHGQTTEPMSRVGSAGTTATSSTNVRSYTSRSGNNVDPEFPQSVDINRILSGRDVRTTIMLRNIPNKMQQHELIQHLNGVVFGSYNFVYLRIDFRNGCNVGYAFVNLIHPMEIVRVYQHFHGHLWGIYHSDKRAVISYAAIQGLDGLIAKFRNSCVMCEHPQFQPRLFHVWGEDDVGMMRDFPSPDNMSKVRRSVENANNVGLFPPQHKGNNNNNKSNDRRRRSQYDRGTPRAMLEDNHGGRHTMNPTATEFHYGSNAATYGGYGSTTMTEQPVDDRNDQGHQASVHAQGAGNHAVLAPGETRVHLTNYQAPHGHGSTAGHVVNFGHGNGRDPHGYASTPGRVVNPGHDNGYAPRGYASNPGHGNDYAPRGYGSTPGHVVNQVRGNNFGAAVARNHVTARHNGSFQDIVNMQTQGSPYDYRHTYGDSGNQQHQGGSQSTPSRHGGRGGAYGAIGDRR